MKGLIAVGVTALLLTGCQAGPVKRQVAFPADEYAALEKTGTSSVSGQLFLRTVGGDVKYGAGSQVIVTPVTSYTQEATMIYLRGAMPESADPRARAYTRRTIADGTGRFEVDSLPAGEYYVAGGVYWQVPGSYAPNQGGMVIQQITLDEGESKEVMLTK